MNTQPSPIKAMILAAGRGKRMMPLTASIPKPLLKLNDKPLLEYTIENLQRSGIKDLVINHSYLGEQIEAYFQTGSQLGVKIAWSREKLPLETAGGIIKALPILGNSPFIIVNGDTWCNINFNQLIKKANIPSLIAGDTLAHLVLVANPAHNPNGDFGLNNGLVNNSSPKKLTYAGISVLSPQLLENMPKDEVIGLAPLLKQAADKKQVSGHQFNGIWQDIGTPQRLKSLRQQMAKKSN